MPPLYFPLRWESTGEQWWYATPIDWAAANGLYDVVRELLHVDTNLLIKLTSLRRIRRLETVWDDEDQFSDVAKCRSHVAKKLLLEGEIKGGNNSLIRAGYGGWLLYTAASAGDVAFVMELLKKDPLLVFGEGEYGVTDIFYAAARSKNCEVFRVLLDFALSPRCWGEETMEPPLEESEVEMLSTFRWEMINRAVHCAARGGHLQILMELLGDCPQVLIYRDAQGSTILHTAAGRGQLEVVKNLVASFDIISATDGQGNTSLHVAAYRGHLSVVELLIHECPSSSSLSNYHGDSLLHLAVAGFGTPGFRRLDRQIELMNRLIHGELINVPEIINIQNNDGRTALHMAVTENIQSDLVELLISAPSIDLNICDADGSTPLDLLKQQPRSPSSEILIKRLISAGAISNSDDCIETKAFSSRFRIHGIGRSPGTSFRIPDAEVFLYTGTENVSDATRDEIDECESVDSSEKNSSHVNYAARRLKFLLRRPKRGEENASGADWGDDEHSESNSISLRRRFSSISCIPHDERTLTAMNTPPSTSAKKKFAAGLMQGVIQVTPRSAIPVESRWSSLSGSPMASRSNWKVPKFRQDSFNRKMMMNEYFCFGAHGLAVEDSISSGKRAHQNHKLFSSMVA